MKEKKKTKSIIIIVVIILVILVIAFGLGDEESIENNTTETTTKENTKTETTESGKLTLEEGYSGKADEYGISYQIDGYVTNNTDRDYSYVEIEFTAYDKDGNTLGTCLDNNSGLEKGGRWKFSASCLENVNEIANFKLKDLSGY